MIGICAPYNRSETTLAASMVAHAFQSSGTSVRWFLEGKAAPDVELGWESHLVRDNAKGHKLAKCVNCWVYFTLGSHWPRYSRSLPKTTRHLVFRDWRQFSARWGGPKPTRLIAAEESQPAFRNTQKLKYDFVRWSAGVTPVQQVAPRANKVITVMLLVDRFTCCSDLHDSLAAIERWTSRGHRVLLCSWSTASRLTEKYWTYLVLTNPKFEWHRKPTFNQLKLLALESDCCILPHRSTAYGAWVAFFRSLGVWTIGNSMLVVNGSLDNSVATGRVSGNKVVDSNIWKADPYRPTAMERSAAYHRSAQVEEQFAEYWNNVWTRPTS